MSTVDAILSLLEDPDPKVREPLQQRLSEDRALLEAVYTATLSMEADPDPGLTALVLREDAEPFIDRFARCDDLEAGCWLLAQLHRPRYDFATPGTAALNALAERMGSEADGIQIAEFLCRDCGFIGDQVDYHDPRNNYLSDLLQRRSGLPITLVTLWQLIGRRLGVDCEAIALPGHVVGRWQNLYIDLFIGGRIVTVADLDARMHASGIISARPYLAAASDRALLRRMARNLLQSYTIAQDRVRATIAHGLVSI